MGVAGNGGLSVGSVAGGMGVPVAGLAEGMVTSGGVELSTGG